MDLLISIFLQWRPTTANRNSKKKKTLEVVLNCNTKTKKKTHTWKEPPQADGREFGYKEK